MENEQQNTPLFEDRALQLAEQRDAAAVARATQEIQASLVIAQRFPRNEVKAKAKILEACRRKGLAEVAEFEYSRGGQTITGPTVDLLRAIASRWGNLLYGWTEVERFNGQSSVRCWAWDTQSNARAERTFVMKHWRDTKSGGYLLEDERDIYELVANYAARRVRACMEEIIDSDLIEDAVNACRETLKTGEKTPLIDRVVRMVDAFKKFGVTQEQIETRLGKKAEAISEIQLASLRRIYKGLADGIGTPEQFFPVAEQVKDPNFGATGKPEGGQNAGGPAQTPQPGTAPVPPGNQATVPAATPAPSATPAAEEPNVIKAIRGMLTMGKFKENELLSTCIELESIPAETTSLEALMLSNPATVQRIHDHFGTMASAIKDWRKTNK